MRKEFAILGVIIITVMVGAYLASNYYRGNVQNERKPDATPVANLVREDSPSLGPADAKVTIVEFLDPECESCAAFGPSVKKVVKEYDGRVRLVIRYMPLHPNSVPAANFLESAGEQGKYWEALDMIFAKQGEWGERHGAPASATKPDVPKLLAGYARDLGLDVDKVNQAISSNSFSTKIYRDRKDGNDAGVRQTPTLFVNSIKLTRLSEPELRTLVESELNK